MSDKLQRIRGQNHAKRAMEIAACGGFAVALIGPPGCGKTLLADCFSEYVKTVVEARPCPCGAYGDPFRGCKCTAEAVQDVQDTFRCACEEYNVPIRVEVPSLRARELQEPDGEPWEVVKMRIDLVRIFRMKHPDALRMNLDADCRRIMESVVDRLGFSQRVVEQAKRVARVIADMDGSEAIRAPHLAEAVQYRGMP